MAFVIFLSHGYLCKTVVTWSRQDVRPASAMISLDLTSRAVGSHVSISNIQYGPLSKSLFRPERVRRPSAVAE